MDMLMLVCVRCTCEEYSLPWLIDWVSMMVSPGEQLPVSRSGGRTRTSFVRVRGQVGAGDLLPQNIGTRAWTTGGCLRYLRSDDYIRLTLT